MDYDCEVCGESPAYPMNDQGNWGGDFYVEVDAVKLHISFWVDLSCDVRLCDKCYGKAHHQAIETIREGI